MVYINTAFLRIYSHPESFLKFNIQNKLENKRIWINMQNEVTCLFTYNWAKTIF